MDKVYTLPDLPAAPTNNLGLLVRRLIEYADWSVLPALLDEMTEQGRHYELNMLKGQIFRTLDPAPYYMLDSWKNWCESLLHLFLFDLFSVESVMDQMCGRKWLMEREILDRQLSLSGTINSSRFLTLPQAVHYRAAEDLPADSTVIVDRDNGVVRRAPTNDLNSFIPPEHDFRTYE
jgi:hypothetical protein